MTPNTMDHLSPKSQEALAHEYTHRPGRSNPNNLRDQIAVTEGQRTWPTPVADDTGTRKKKYAQGGTPLSMEVQNWPTPSATPRGPHTHREVTAGGQTVSHTTGTSYGMTLETAIKHWPTPTEDDSSNVNPKPNRRPGLVSKVNEEEHHQIKKWPTPTVSDHKGSGPTIIRKDGKSRMDRLDYATEQTWPTPTAMEAGKIGNRANYGQKGLSNHPAIVGLPDREKMKKSENDGNNSGVSFRLNPTWVSWLMGLPTGWESLEPMSQEAYDTWFEEMRNGTWWDTERDLPRVTKENNDRVKRLRALGNGIVPASLAEFIRSYL